MKIVIVCNTILVTFAALCYATPLQFTVEKNVDVWLEYDEHVQRLKEAGAWDLIGTEFAVLFNYTNLLVDDLNQQTEEIVNEWAAKYYELVHEFNDIKDAVKNGIDEVAHFNETLTHLTEIVDKTPRKPSQYREMQIWAEEMKKNNYETLDSIRKSLAKFINEINNFRASIEIIETNVPSEDAMKNNIDTRINVFQHTMSSVVQLFNRQLHSFVDRTVLAMKNHRDEKVIQMIGITQIEKIRRAVETHYEILYEQINNERSAVEKMYEHFKDGLSSMERTLKSYINELHQPFSTGEFVIKIEIVIINKLSSAKIYLVNADGKTPINNDDYIPFFGKMETENLNNFELDEHHAVFELSGYDKDGEKYLRTYMLDTIDEKTHHVREEYNYPESKGTYQQKYIFEY